MSRGIPAGNNAAAGPNAYWPDERLLAGLGEFQQSV
jgi:hypothetical protein